MEYLTLTEIGKILDLGVFYLATKGTCGNPRVRPMRSNIVHNGKLYFGTTCQKNLYKHITQYSGVEICISTADILALRVRGEARVANHLDVKEALMAKYERLRPQDRNNTENAYILPPHWRLYNSNHTVRPPSIQLRETDP